MAQGRAARPHDEKRSFLRDNALSIAFVSLFFACLAGESLFGLSAYNQEMRSQGFRGVSYGEYLSSGHFLEGVFVNWQAAILQLATLIIFSIFLRQQGAAHSKKTKGSPHRLRGGFKMSGLSERERGRSWIYRNSLSLAFISIFLVTFACHVYFGTMDFNRRQELLHESRAGVFGFLGSSPFWFKTLQTWQAEFFAIAVYLIASVFLRQQHSAESKQLGASDQETGNTNE